MMYLKLTESESASSSKPSRLPSPQKPPSNPVQCSAASRILIRIIPLAALYCLAASLAASAATVAWTNAAGGAWSQPANWSPNRLPGPADDAVITLSGSYAVMLDQDATAGGLVLGGAGGAQVLTNISSVLTLNTGGMVNTNGALAWAGGQLNGPGLLNIEGALVCANVGISCAVSVSTNGFVSVSGQPLQLSGVMTNAGVVCLGGQAGLTLNGYANAGQFYNLPGGLVVNQADCAIAGSGAPGELFCNLGILRATNGTLTITANGSGNGRFIADAGAVLNFAGAYAVSDGGSLIGEGTNMITGSLAIEGNVNSSNVVLASGDFWASNGIMQGAWVWAGGSFSGTPTVATNGSLAISLAGVTFDLQASLTNAGTIQLVGDGELRLDGFYFNGGQLINLPGGQILSQGNVSLKTLGYGTEFFTNGGMLEVQTGNLSLVMGGTGAGQFIANAGATLTFPGDFTLNAGSVLAGAGTNLFSGGNITVDGAVNGPNTIMAGGNLQGAGGVIGGGLTWTGGNILDTLTVGGNAVFSVSIPDGGLLNFFGVLTNQGTILLAGNGNLQCNGNYLGAGRLYNMPGGRILSQGNVVLASAGVGTEFLSNSGLIEAQNGSLTLAVGGTGAGQFASDAGALLAWSADFALNNGGSLTGLGTNLMEGGNLTLNGAVASLNAVLAGANVTANNAVLNGAWTWSGGTISGALTVASNATLNVTPPGGAGLVLAGCLMNAGSVSLAGAGNLQLSGASGGGRFINLPGAVVSAGGAAGITGAGYSNEFVLNEGIFLNEGGSNTTSVSASFENLGVVDAESGVLSFDGVYTQTNGTLQFGLAGLQNHGVVNFAGPAPLEGTLAFNLNGGYSPNPGDTFTLMTYPSFTGGFSDTNQAFLYDWQTSVGGRQTTVAVLQKVIGAVPPAIVAQPLGANLLAGQEASFAVGVAGSAPITYQWRLNGVNLPGAMESALILGAAHPSLGGRYSVVARNAAGAVTSSDATLGVTGIRPLSLAAPAPAGGSFSLSIATQPDVGYVLERKFSLTDPFWTMVQSLPGTGAPILLSDSSGPWAAAFYRIRLQ